MSKFTIQSPSAQPTLITLEEDMPGQVDIMVHFINGESCRLAAIGDGKLHLFRMSHLVATAVGIELDSSGYPIITLV